MLNNINVIGNLTRDPEIRYTNNSTAVSNISIANDTGWGDKKKTHFITVVAWGKLAENVSRFCKSGTQICVSGRLEMESYTTREGENRKAWKVVAESIDFLARTIRVEDRSDQRREVVSDVNLPVIDEEISLDELPF